jgi:hypothetical protein
MWRAPTASDLHVCLMSDEVEGFQVASVTSGQDATQAAIDEAVGVFRAAIRSGGKNDLGAAGTLPQECIGPAMDRAAYKFLSRVGGKIGETRAQLYRDSDAFRKECAAGTLLFAGPDEDDDDSTAAVGPSIAPRTPTLDRASQEGL